ncbi:response regulator [Pseudooceanicola sp.]|jgi:CheY-like chemotaxis protein|uniref:response regulator n=1 Tax=Pseudooceanicola sp. TaxID=1914328 RepID=UPI00405A469F
MSGLAVSAAPKAACQKAGALTCAVLDDSLIDRYLICHALKEVFDDSVTVEFATAAEARRYLEERVVDVLLADRVLPDGDGADFALSPPEGTAVVLLSGDDCTDVTERLDASGRARFLHKDDLSGKRLAEALLPLVRKQAEVVPLHGSRGPADDADPATGVSPVTRGLRLLRTVRARKDRTGGAEIAELLNEIERILLDLRPRGH